MATLGRKTNKQRDSVDPNMRFRFKLKVRDMHS